MKKLAAVILAVVLVVLTFTACSNGSQKTENNDGKIKVVTTIFPIYDWVKNIDADGACDVSFLLNSGADLHSYQPTADDMVKMADCDLFIYVGGESDKWVEDALKNAVNKNMVVVNLLDVLKDRIKEEEIKEGMQAEEEEEETEEPEYDEHIWLSLKNASVCVSAISDALCKADSNNSEKYKLNAKVYNDKLSALDKQYSETVKTAKNKTLVFGDRFPFRYLVDDYGLDYYAAFVGCSAESEASFETITFLANKVDELNLNYVMTIENSDNKLANTIVENTGNKNAEIFALDSLQNTTEAEATSGKTYLETMESNLNVLKIVLN